MRHYILTKVPIPSYFKNFFYSLVEKTTHNLTVYEIGTGNFVGKMPELYRISELSFSSEGHFLITGHENGKTNEKFRNNEYK